MSNFYCLHRTVSDGGYILALYRTVQDALKARKLLQQGKHWLLLLFDTFCVTQYLLFWLNLLNIFLKQQNKYLLCFINSMTVSSAPGMWHNHCDRQAYLVFWSDSWWFTTHKKTECETGSKTGQLRNPYCAPSSCFLEWLTWTRWLPMHRILVFPIVVAPSL